MPRSFLLALLVACGPTDEVLVAELARLPLPTTTVPVPPPGAEVPPYVEVRIPWALPPIVVPLRSVGFAGAPPPPVDPPVRAGLGWQEREAEAVRWRQLFDDAAVGFGESSNTTVMIGPGGGDPRAGSSEAASRGGSLVRPQRGDLSPDEGVRLRGRIVLGDGLSASELIGGQLNLDLVRFGAQDERVHTWFDMPVGSAFELYAPPDVGEVRLLVMVDTQAGMIGQGASELLVVGSEPVDDIVVRLEAR